MTAHSEKRSSVGWRRLLVILLLAATVAGAIATDVFVEDSANDPPATAINDEAAPVSARSSAWYCAMVPSRRADPAAGTVLVLNETDAAISGTASVFSSAGGPSVDAPVNVPAHTRVAIQPGTLLDAPFAAVAVRMDAGGAVVEHGVRDANGEAFTPCSTAASSELYFPDGSSEAGATMQVGLFNPFLDDAIVDFRLMTSDGRADPDELKSVVVPARSMQVLSISDRVRRRAWIAGTVIARTGRVVADQLQGGVLAGSPALGFTGMANSKAEAWYFPGAVVDQGLTHRVSVYNPNPTEAAVAAELYPDAGEALPFALRVPAGGRVAVDFHGETRVPRGVGYGVAVRSTDGQPVVASQVLTSGPPSLAVGGTLQIGSKRLAKTWALPAGTTAGANDEYVWVLNPGPNAAEVRYGLTGDGKLAPVPPVRIEPGRRALIHVDDLAPTGSSSVVVESSEPVVVGREQRVIPGKGFAASAGIPLR